MKKLKALVIDDSKVMRLMVMRGLRQARVAAFTFEEAANGREGLEKFNAEPQDIVFVDWNMPEMSGVEFSRVLRQDYGVQVPIVMITSEKSAGKRMEALQKAGASLVISKPFTPDELETRLEPIIADLGG